MQSSKENKIYLPNIKFPKNIKFFSSLEESLHGSEKICIALPSNCFRDILKKIQHIITKNTKIFWATKGFEADSGKLPHVICEEVLGTINNMAVISGPSFAIEVAQKKPTALTVASENTKFADEIAHDLSDINFRAYTSNDVVGVEVGGAVKNIVAIGAGISDGLNYGDNAKIALINRGLVEMQRLGVALGANKNTFFGLSGMGDLVLTCTSNLSRNRRLGLAIAEGQSISKFQSETKQVVEGFHATSAVYQLSKKIGIDMPICDTIYQILVEKLNPQNAAALLMSRALQNE